MAYVDKIFSDEYVPDEQASKTHQNWERDNKNGDAPKWHAFRDAVLAYEAGDSIVIPSMSSPHGKALVAAGKLHMSVTDIGAEYAPVDPPDPPPPPLPTGNPYWVSDFTTGKFLCPPWTTLFSYGTNTGPGGGAGFYDLTQTGGGATGTTDGRTRIAPNPSGTGNVARYEIRDADPGWPNNTTLDKSVSRSVPQYTWNQSQANVGDIRWFSTQLYLPYNATEKFEWAHTGGNAFLDILDLHPNSGTAWPAFSLQWYAGASPEWAKFRVAGGPTINSTQYLTEYNLWQLTNSSGARILTNHNRWISLLWGMKFAPDNTGWLQVEVDGVLVLPQTSRPTMWAGDNAMFFQQGLYKQKNAIFPETGRSVLYMQRTLIGLTKADVV